MTATDAGRESIDRIPQMKGCTLIGCTDPRSVHDHHYSRGHLDIAACHCSAQTGEPGVSS